MQQKTMVTRPVMVVTVPKRATCGNVSTAIRSSGFAVAWNVVHSSDAKRLTLSARFATEVQDKHDMLWPPSCRRLTVTAKAKPMRMLWTTVDASSGRNRLRIPDTICKAM